MSGYTKGPWTARGTDVYFPNCAGGLSVRHCPDAEANARLIAAAPELLEALENVEREHECLNWMKACEKRRGKGMLGIAVETDELALEWQTHEKSLQGLVNARRAAIAKARGEV